MTSQKRYSSCNGHQLKKLLHAGMSWLENNHQRVNDLNVFPVPDGDTGTNMLLTMRNAYREISEFEDAHVGKVASKIAHGAVMGSRGNSGTIMSQICSGFAEALREHDALSSANLAGALRRATDKAYGGVQHPVEGTILTVIREITEAIEALPNETDRSLDEILELIVAEGWQSVQRTPDLLPVLKDAGVVDSGGTGLMYVLEGMLRLVRGEAVDVAATSSFEEQIAREHTENGVVQHPGVNFYDVQFIIKGDLLDSDRIKRDIEAMGESAVIVAAEQLVKVHVHVADPSTPIGYAVQQGQITDVVVENMLEQYEAFVEKHGKASVERSATPRLASVQPGEIAVVAVTPGPGFAEIFENLQVTALVNGGQTNNPSVEEFVTTFEAINTDKIILLPNNKNIILTAQQAANITQDKAVVVIPTRTVPQGISAMFPYQPRGDLHDVAAAMEETIQDIVTGEITTAVRDATIEEIHVKKGQVIGLLNGKLRTVGEAISSVAHELLAQADLEDKELITVYYGQEILEDEALVFADTLAAHFPELEIEVLPGGQPHYPYILSVE